MLSPGLHLFDLRQKLSLWISVSDELKPCCGSVTQGQVLAAVEVFLDECLVQVVLHESLVCP